MKKSSLNFDGQPIEGNKLGTLIGVYCPTIQNIFGVILFIRMSWIVGVCGIYEVRKIGHIENYCKNWVSIFLRLNGLYLIKKPSGREWKIYANSL